MDTQSVPPGIQDLSALRRVWHRRRLILFVYALMTIVATPGLTLIENDNSPPVFFARDHVALERYLRFQGFFGRDDSLRIVIEGDGLWTRQGLDWLADVERDVRRWTGVMGSIGLYGRHRWEIESWPPDPRLLRETAVADSLDRGAGWIDPAGRITTVLVALSRLSPERARALLDRLKAYLDSAPEGVRVELVGLPVVNRAFDTQVESWIVRIFPLFVLVAVTLLALAFRRASNVLLPLTQVGVSQVVLFGAMGYAGVRMNMVLVLLLPLLFVISLATAVHILVRFRQHLQSSSSPFDALMATYREKTWPTFWAGATTAAGFASLTVSQVPPVRDFGLWSAVGIAFITVTCFTFYPALLGFCSWGLKVPGTGYESATRNLGKVWSQRAALGRKWVYAFFAGSAILMLLGGARLRLDSNALHYLPATHPARQNLEDLQAAGIGAIAVELAVERGTLKSDLESPEALRLLSHLSERIRKLPLVLGAVGPGDIVDGAFSIVPEEEFPGETRWSEAVRRLRDNPETRPLLGAVLTRGGSAARLTMLVEMLGHSDLEPVFGEALELARESFPGADIYLTGQYKLVLDAQTNLPSTMLYSLLLTLLAVALAFRLLTRSLRLTLLALVPNLWPVAFVIGILGWVGLPLDSTTVMIAAVVLGLAVDDTLHTLGAFRRFSGRVPPFQAAVLALGRTAPAHILTTLILSAGFAMCGSSGFVPISRFGGVAAAALLGALVSDLWLTPALLAGVPKPLARAFSQTSTNSV